MSLLRRGASGVFGRYGNCMKDLLTMQTDSLVSFHDGDTDLMKVAGNYPEVVLVETSH